jgi:uncharacterized protein
VNIIVKESSIHGRGCFATKQFKAGEKIGQMKGLPAIRDSMYTIWVENEGTRVTNNLKFLNHSQTPNAIVREDLTVVACEDIAVDQEITFDYGVEDGFQSS